MTVAIRLIIHGRVQGVGYRSWTKGRATALGLTGWVRNRTDGTVEAVLCGPADAVDAICAECLAGPLAANVTGIDTTPWAGDIPVDFRQLPSV